MSHDVIETEVIETEAGIFRIEIEQDDDAMSPRDADSLGTFVITRNGMCNGVALDETQLGRSGGTWWTVSVVVEAVNDGRISTRGACRYLRTLLDAWAVVPVCVRDDWAPEVYAVGEDPQLGVSVQGFVWDTAARRAVMGPETPDQAEKWLREEVEALSRWTSGEYVMYSIERLVVDEWDEQRPDVDDVEDDPSAYPWDLVESLSSIDDLSYAREEARATVNAFTLADFPSPRERRALAAQV